MQHPSAGGVVAWRTATACNGGNCVQAAAVDGGSVIALRDSKNPTTVLFYSAQEWTDFLDGVGRGDFDSLPTG
jgi:Domain of unknown function (DUF397)